jgi:threonine aldolase
MMARSDELQPRPTLLVLENTHNRSAGAVLPVTYHSEVAKLAGKENVPIHLDGARLFNAVTALQCVPIDITSHVTSVAVNLNKGLGAPAGAILAGPRPFIRDALRVRQRLGGGMRPMGFIAAAGLEALRTMPGRIVDDHVNAKLVANGLSSLPGIKVIAPTPSTNLLVLEISESLASVTRFLASLACNRVLGLPFHGNTVRLVFHREIDRSAAAEVIKAIKITVAQLEADPKNDLATSAA